MARYWLKSWREASFRGARFWVDKDDLETGRRLVTHEFPHRDTPYIEDLGRKANKVQVTAYIASDAADSETKSLYDACGKRGSATLVLPSARMRAHCESCTRAWEKDRQGYFAFNLSFVVDGGSAAPVSTPYLSRLTYSSANDMATPLEERVSALVQVTGQAGFLRDDAVAEIQAIAGAIDTVRAALPIAPDKSPTIALGVQALFDDADVLADIGAVGDRYGDVSFIETADGSASAPVAERVVGLLSSMREAVTDQTIAAREIGSLTSYGTDAAAGDTATPSERQSAANVAALSELVRVAALGQWVVAMTEAEYTDRRGAIQARADVAETIDAELDRLDGPASYGVYLALAGLRGNATQFFTLLLTDLAPVLLVGAPRSMPSLWWANTLYADAARAGEIADRNGAIHPSFMPLEIEALAR